MKTVHNNGKSIRSHTWRDIGGLFGLILNGAFFCFIVVVGALWLLFVTILLGLDVLCSKALGLVSRAQFRVHHPVDAVTPKEAHV